MKEQKTEIDLDQLKEDIEKLKPDTPLFELLKAQLEGVRTNKILYRLVKEELTKLELWATDELFLKWLKERLPIMERWQPIYKITKDILNHMGYWRDKARGNPSLGYTLGFGKRKKRLQ